MRYYRLSEKKVAIVGDPTARHTFNPVHDGRIVELNQVIDGVPRKYLAYDSDPVGCRVSLYYTDDLDGQWTPYSANPILTSADAVYRWPNCVWDGATFHLFLDNQVATRVERWTSTDGVHFMFAEVIVAATKWMNPFVYRDPNDNDWYLYWKKHGEAPNRELYVRHAATLEGLAAATDELLGNDDAFAPAWAAAPSVMFRDGLYWLNNEVFVDGVWKTVAYHARSPRGPFEVTDPAFIIEDDGACAMQYLSPDGTRAYSYVSHYNRLWRQFYYEVLRRDGHPSPSR